MRHLQTWTTNYCWHSATPSVCVCGADAKSVNCVVTQCDLMHHVANHHNPVSEARQSLPLFPLFIFFLVMWPHLLWWCLTYHKCFASLQRWGSSRSLLITGWHHGDGTFWTLHKSNYLYHHHLQTYHGVRECYKGEGRGRVLQIC